MPYLYHTDEDRAHMLDALRLESEEDLFDHIPKELRLERPLSIGEGKNEFETLRYFEALARRNTAAAAMTSCTPRLAFPAA